MDIMKIGIILEPHRTVDCPWV